jgi:hypothetical protein
MSKSQQTQGIDEVALGELQAIGWQLGKEYKIRVLKT